MKNKVLSLSLLAFICAHLFVFPSLAQTLTITGETNPCAGSSVTYVAQQPAPPAGYIHEGVSWYLDFGSIGGGQNAFSQFISFSSTTGGGSRTVRAVARYYKDENNQRSYINYVGELGISIRQISDAVQSLQPDGMQIECGQTPVQTFSINVTQITSQLNYTWTVPSGWNVLSSTNGASITVQASPNTGGAVSVTVTDTKCNTAVTRTANIIRTVPQLGAISGGAGCFCAGQTQSFSVSPISGATSYVWGVTGSLSIASGQGTTNVSVGSSGSGGLLTCYAVTACGNTNTVSSSYINTSTSAPQTPNITVTATPCSNYRRSGQLTITNADPCATYYWSADAGVSIGGGNPSASVDVASAGSRAYVYGVNACGASGTGARIIPALSNCTGYLRMAQDTLGVSAAPNPFSNQTTISFTLPEEGTAQLDVVSPLRGVVAQLAQGKHEAGKHDVSFDASRLPSGVYTARLVFNPKGSTKPQQISIQLIVQR